MKLDAGTKRILSIEMLFIYLSFSSRVMRNHFIFSELGFKI